MWRWRTRLRDATQWRRCGEQFCTFTQCISMKARAEARSCLADPAVLLYSAGVTDYTLSEAMKRKLSKKTRPLWSRPLCSQRGFAWCVCSLEKRWCLCWYDIKRPASIFNGKWRKHLVPSLITGVQPCWSLWKRGISWRVIGWNVGTRRGNPRVRVWPFSCSRIKISWKPLCVAPCSEQLFVRTWNISIHLQSRLHRARVLDAFTTPLYSFKVARLAYLAAAASSRATKHEA